MTPNTLSVWIDSEKVGTLAQERDDYIFSYLPGLSLEKSISLTMPYRLQSYNTRRLQPIFQMNLPEGYLRETLRHWLKKIYQLDELNWLALLGADQIGRLGFSINDQPPQATTLQHEDFQTLLLEDHRNLFKSLVDRYALHSGVAGVQPKVLLEIQGKASLPVGPYILKAWGPEFPHLAENEFFCMEAVRRAGLPVMPYQISNEGHFFITERFDILNGQRLGFEDFCVLQGLGTEEKYTGSYERATKIIATYVSPPNRKQALLDFFKALLMSVYLRNGDAHLKNFGLLYATPFQDVRLAPIYDMVTTSVYIPEDIPALMINGTKNH